MNKKISNPSAQKTVNQINSTLMLLQEKSLCFTYNMVPLVPDRCQHCQITWHNHIPGRVNSNKSFGKLAQYHHILETNSYHCVLFDGSLIRVNFEFENDLLLKQNLLWWPSPYEYDADRLKARPLIDCLEELYSDPNWYQNIKMRSPIRIDFDSTNNQYEHPHSHLHIQNGDTRIDTKEPICFNRFISFIFRNFYPSFKLFLSQHDFICYKIPDMEKRSSHFSQVTI